MAISKIYRELTDGEMGRIATDLFGGKCKIKDCRILKGGLFNTTYKVQTDGNGGALVIRVGPVNKHLLFDFEKDMMAMEPYFHRLLRDHSIPTAKVIKYSPENTVLERDYIVTEYIESIPMNDPSLRDTDLSAVYEDLGLLTRKLHGIRNGKFGWLRETDWGLYDRWPDFILRFSDEAACKAETSALLPREDIDLFRGVIRENLSIMDEITVPCMAHTDLWQGNVLLSKMEGAYEIVGIIDLDRTIFGDTCWDFSTPWVINASFIKGYGESVPDGGHFLTRQNIYKLIAGLFGMYVCLIEYDDLEWFGREKEKFVTLLHEMNAAG